jgi:uroporphyrin-3 C-methyltransferase
MNDIVDQQASAASGSSSSATPSTPESQVPRAADAKGRAWLSLWPIIAVAALALAGWQWYETRVRLAETQLELARRLVDIDGVAKESRTLSRQAQEQIAAMQGKLGELDGKIEESASQQAALETLYQDLASNRDESVLSEIEQNVTLAAHQLQLAGNVQAAVLALQSADARLADSSRPQFIVLRKVLVRDLDKLRALPQIDLPGMNVRLESVIEAVEILPLAVDGRPRDEGPTPADAGVAAATPYSVAFWKGLVMEFWGELRSLIRIQRFDRDEPALLAPGQDFFLRENLKLRLLNARLAMLSRDQWTFRNELKQAQSWVDRYFDNRDRSVQVAQETLRQLSAAEINIELPNLNESLSAIKSFKLGGERQ